MEKIIINKEEFAQKIVKLVNFWNISRERAVYYHEETFKKVHGYADREKGEPVCTESIYSFTLLAMAVMKLAVEKKLTVEQEYREAGKIPILNPLKFSSGIPDYFYNKIMGALLKDEAHQNLPEPERISSERRLFYENSSLKRVLYNFATRN